MWVSWLSKDGEKEGTKGSRDVAADTRRGHAGDAQIACPIHKSLIDIYEDKAFNKILVLQERCRSHGKLQTGR